MLMKEIEKLYPSAKTLVREKVASRIHAKDATLYNFDPESQECAEHFVGWVDLASNPPYSYKKIKQFANAAQTEGLETVLLIGQGGSTQAPMTITKYNKFACPQPNFKEFDSVSPVRL